MYQITCDGFPIYDPRDDELIVGSPKVNLEVNKVGDGSFTIYKNHPYYGRLMKLKSVFEISDDIGVIFRGRMTEDSCDFNNSMLVDLEGAMAYFNDSKVRPYAFPEDFLTDAEYITASESGNVVEFFLKWLIVQHNKQTAPFQHFKLGRVTVSDPNNYITRSDSNYPSTWEVLKSKLFESNLGGFLCIRYEADGNYIDYLSKFELVNTQEIVFGENLLNLTTDSDAKKTYSAIIPIGATIETEHTDEEGNSYTEKSIVTLADIEDGLVTDDVVKEGDIIYSKSAVDDYGYIFPPVKETTWNDVTDAQNLLTKAVESLVTNMMLLSESVEVVAVDLHFTDEQVQSFRIYRNVNVKSTPHGHSGTYQLSKLGLDLERPQNTKITVGATRRTLTDINSQKESDTIQRIESAIKDIEETRSETTEIKNQLLLKSTSIINDVTGIFMTALEEYVSTSSFESFKESMRTDFGIYSNGISGRVTDAEERIQDVGDDLQTKFNTITKYFTFDINGLTIGQIDSPNKVVIDNDEISILVNNVVVQKFDSNGKALIPELSITRMLNLLGLIIEQDGNNINCEYMGV